MGVVAGVQNEFQVTAGEDLPGSLFKDLNTDAQSLRYIYGIHGGIRPAGIHAANGKQKYDQNNNTQFFIGTSPFLYHVKQKKQARQKI